MEKLNKIFRTQQTAVIDKYTIEHEPVSSLDLMERAAGIWTDCFLQTFGNVTTIAVIAGNGNNGGDGYVIARFLKEAGSEVTVFHVKASGGISADCEANLRRWTEMGGTLKKVTSVEDLEIDGEAVIIDAIFGSGLNRPVTGVAAEVIRRINALPNSVVAVDMPSGLMGEDNSANDPEAVIRADYTFTFQFPKLAFLLPENAGYVGDWRVLDIGLSREMMEQTETPWFYTGREEAAGFLPRPGKFDHKGTNGRGLLIAGSDGMLGAAVLAAKAAVRSGVGLLYCHVPARGKEIMQIAVPEALLQLDRNAACFSGASEVSKYDAIAIGPALGQQPESVAGLRNLLTAWRGTTILDADALNILSEHQEMLELLHDRCILTPHIKEFERLAGKSENDFDRLNKLSTFASRYKVYIVLKGAFTVVATPGGQLFFNMSGNPGMAKGGAGDVLTGVLLGLAANGMDPLDVARIGVFAHGMSGDMAVRECGFRGLASGMIAEGMGKVWKELEQARI